MGYQPQISYLQAAEANISGQTARFVMVDASVDRVIRSIMLEIPTEVRTANEGSMTITIMGPKNPDFVDQYNSIASLEVSILGDSVYSTQIKARTSTNFTTGLKASALSSVDVYSEQPWPNSKTFIELAFTMKPRLAADRQALVVLEFEPGFTIKSSELKCEDLFKNAKYACEYEDSSL